MTSVSEFFKTLHPNTLQRLEQKRLKALDPTIEVLRKNDASRLELEFSQEYKRKITQHFVKSLYPQLNFQTHEGIKDRLVRECGLFPEGFDFYASEDLIKGTANQLPIAIAEIRTALHQSRAFGTGGLYAKPNRYSKLSRRQLLAGQREVTEKRNRRSTLQLFNGLFAIIDLPLAFNGWLTIKPKRTRNWFARLEEEIQLALSLLTNPKMRVSIDNPKFRRAYIVLSSDQQLARDILTPKLLDNILGMQKFTEWLGLSFIDGHLCLAIEEPEDLLEPNLNLPVADERQLKNVQADIDLIMQMIEELALNDCF